MSVRRRGRAKSTRRARGPLYSDDSFSRALASQGDDGQVMRMLYLRNPMITYAKKLGDESIKY